MKLSNILQLILCIALVAAGVALSFERRADKRVLMATDDHDIDYPTTQGLVKIKEIIEKRTNGRLRVIVRPGAQLGSEKETIELTQMGIIDINRVSCSPMAEFAPEFAVYSLPFLFRTREHQRHVLDGPIGRRLLGLLAQRRLIGLAYYDSGARSFYNNKRPINSPADLKGLKIRVQKSEVMIDLVKALGASPDPIAFEEVYSSIQTGRIDGAENNAPSYLTTSHFEVAKYYSLDEHARVPEVVIMSKSTWDALNAADQKLIAGAAHDSQAYQINLWIDFEVKAMKTVRAKGSKINRPAPALFEKMSRPLYDKYGAAFGNLIRKIRNTK